MKKRRGEIPRRLLLFHHDLVGFLGLPPLFPVLLNPAIDYGGDVAEGTFFAASGFAPLDQLLDDLRAAYFPAAVVPPVAGRGAEDLIDPLLPERPPAAFAFAFR